VPPASMHICMCVRKRTGDEVASQTVLAAAGSSSVEAVSAAEVVAVRAVRRIRDHLHALEACHRILQRVVHPDNSTVLVSQVGADRHTETRAHRRGTKSKASSRQVEKAQDYSRVAAKYTAE
jgi:hypothetical protein